MTMENLILSIGGFFVIILLGFAFTDHERRRRRDRQKRIKGMTTRLAASELNDSGDLQPLLDRKERQRNVKFADVPILGKIMLFLDNMIGTSGIAATPEKLLLMLMLGTTLLAFALSMIIGLPFIIAFPASILLVVGSVFIMLRRKANKRKKQFTTDFPDAIDLMLRGLKAGMPVTASISSVAREVSGPVADEFQRVTEDTSVGKSLDDALIDAAERVDLPEFKFFAIALAIQQETGGKLTEIMAGLSETLRSRRQLKLKVKALSSEATASAYIIGALPFLMFGIITFINPGYTADLIYDPRGIVMSLCAAGWLSIGVMVMMKMVNFKV